MRIRRIAGLVIHYGIILWSKRNEILYYTVFDVIFYGFFSLAMAQLMNNTAYALTIMITIISARPAIVRGAFAIGRTVTDATTGHTLISTLATPITLIDLIAASITTSIAITAIRISIAYTLVATLLNYNNAILLHATLWTLPACTLSGIVLGLFMMALGYYLGRHSLIWQEMIGWGLITISGFLFPISALPAGLRTIAAYLPMTYIFEALRAQLLYDAPMGPLLLKSLWLNLLYGVIAVVVLYWTFRRAKNRGFASLENK